MITLSKKHLERIKDPRFNEVVSYNLFNQNVYLAGGCLRGIFNKEETISDFDIFFYDPSHIDFVANYLKIRNYKIVFKCPEGKLTTYKHVEKNIKIQLITELFFSNLKPLLASFDIEACRIGFNGTEIITTFQAIKDCRRKQININNVEFPNATMRRIEKYINKGFTLTKSGIERYNNLIWLKGLNEIPIDGRFYID